VDEIITIIIVIQYNVDHGHDYGNEHKYLIYKYDIKNEYVINDDMNLNNVE